MTLAYEIAGPKDAPAVFLASSLGSDRHMWDEVMSALSAYRVVRVDFPGHGESATPSVEGEYTPEQLGEAILEVADAEGIEKFHMAGLSLGGMMSLWMAINRPERLESFMMMCSGPVLLPSQAWRDRAEKSRTEGTQSLVEGTLQRWFTPAFYEENGPLVQRTRDTFVSCDDEGYAKCCEVIANMDNREGLGKVSLPMGVVRAEFDGTLPEADANELVEAVKAGGNEEVTLYYVEAAAHLAAVEKPAEVANALLEHLRKYA
ncbi:MAG: alpha/beta fold hydrolase [Actinomycetaceae bacterium]|nr:alpha/beta fold hydrolase [Actinomycetaceae bacterium]